MNEPEIDDSHIEYNEYDISEYAIEIQSIHA